MLQRLRRLSPWLPLALLALAATGCKSKKQDLTYGDRMVGAIRESKAMDARGDMQAVAIAVTQWGANDGNLADAQDLDGLVAALQPTWLRLVPTTDPWGGRYRWRTDGTSWELRSDGKDGKAGNEDDVVMRDGQVMQLPKGFSPMEGK
jgi:hypothetical protein